VGRKEIVTESVSRGEEKEEAAALGQGEEKLLRRREASASLSLRGMGAKRHESLREKGRKKSRSAISWIERSIRRKGRN